MLQLAEEFIARYRQGQRPSLKEYIDRHPELADEIKEVFPAMALMESVAIADESLSGAATGPATPMSSAPAQQLGDYRILREVGRGGMGLVYEAEQVSLGRHVALKVLPRQLFVDDSQRRRFEREARAAARLHHTNIVPVFGVGEHDGLPYYVMQFIQGLGLDDVFNELKRMAGSGTARAAGGELHVARKDVSAADVARSLLTGEFHEPKGNADSLGKSITGKLSDSFALSSEVKLPGSEDAVPSKGKKATYWQSVAQIGVQVAQALEYAHKQGIHHRDIKPSNLLLDTHGTVWVTDFGLARADNEDHLTQTGEIVGTLRYMPPESFEGHADKRSDIYSLGLTLYELLALKPAYAERDRRRLIKRVTTEEPARLEKLNRSIPRDLVTIVHKAIDREPRRRYQTAGELAADLRRFLEDEPIQARRISIGERLARWCRHYPGVASLTGILVLLLVGITVASLLVAAYFDQSRKEAVQAKDNAERQSRRAEANFATARKAVDDSFTTVSESQLLQVPGMQPLRRDLLQSALIFYQGFLRERGDDPSIRGDLAAAYLRVGKIRSELGEKDEARKAWERACELYEELTKATPESDEWRHGLAQCYFWLERLDEAIALWEKLVEPNQPRFQKELAEAYNSRAIRLKDAAHVAEALQDHQRASAIREMLVRLNPEDAVAQRDLGTTLNNMGVLLSLQNRLADALAMYRRAAVHCEAAFAQAPQVLLNGRFLANEQGNIARMERNLGHEKEALAAYRRSVEVWRKLARDNPAISSLHSRLFAAYRELALYYRELRQMEQYEQTMRLARDVIDRLPNEGADALFDLACVRAECSKFLSQGKDKPTTEERAEQKRERDLAMEALRNAIAAGFHDLERLRKEEELNTLRGRDDFKALEADLAAHLAAAPADKLKASQLALELRQKAAQADPKNKRLQADLAASQHAIALIQLEVGQLDKAHKHLQQAIALREALLQEEPKSVQYRTELAVSRFALGDFFWRSGRLAEGTKMWQELESLVVAAGRTRGRSTLASQLFDMTRRVAQHYARIGLWSEAAAHYSRLIPLEGTTDDDYYRAACLAVRAGDAAAYRRICTQRVQQVWNSRDIFRLYYFTWLSCLAEGSGVEPSQVLQWTQQSTQGALPKEWWRCHILGLAYYRAGNFAESIAQASRSNTSKSSSPSGLVNYPVLALAHHRLGHAAEAQHWLDKTRNEWRRLSPLYRTVPSLTVLPTIQKDHWHTFWHDWVTFEILFFEASRVIVGPPAAEEAFDHAHRSLVYGRLGEAAKADAEWQVAITTLPNEPMIWLPRVHQFVEQKRNKEAEEALVKIEAFQSNEVGVWKEAGRLRFALAQPDKAATDLRKAVELLDKKALESQGIPTKSASSEADKLFAKLADDALLSRLAAALERGPEDMDRRWKRGQWYARHRRWKDAAADFRMVLERHPQNNDWYYLNGAVALAAGDREGYHRLCREMLKRFGATQNPATAERIAKSCLLLPESAKGMTEQACELADRAIARGKNHPGEYYFGFSKGLADYRRDHWRASEEGLASLLPRIPSDRPEMTTCCHLVLAMALHRQGQVDTAREHLAKGAKLLDRYVLDLPRFPTIGSSNYNHDWLIAWLLHREAQALIGGNKAPGP